MERSTDDLDADEVQDLEKGMKRKHPLNGLRILFYGCRLNKLGLELSGTRVGLLDIIACPPVLWRLEARTVYRILIHPSSSTRQTPRSHLPSAASDAHVRAGLSDQYHISSAP